MKEKTVRLTVTGVCAALLAVLSQVQIPLPAGIPVTLQTFAVAFIGYLLGAKWGGAAVLLYLALGAAGLPVFSGFSGGAARLFGVTGGYLLGFLPMAALAGLGARRERVPALAFGACGLAVCHLFGAAQYGLLSGVGVWAAFLTASAPYLLKDAVSVLAAHAFARAVRAALEKSGLRLGD